jgi:hypothetical protein
VQNASQSATLLFVKPGKSTNDCSDPNATVRVAPRATMTADLMKTLRLGDAAAGGQFPRLPHHAHAAIDQPHLPQHHIQTGPLIRK